MQIIKAKKSNSVKTIHLVSSLNEKFGGPARSVPHLCGNLETLGVDTRLFSVKRRKVEDNEIITKFNLDWRALEAQVIPRLFYNRSLLTDVITAASDDNVVIHNQSLWTYPVYCGYKAHKLTRSPLVVSPRSTLFYQSLQRSRLKKSIANAFFVRKMLSTANCIHATAPEEYDAIRKLGYRTPIAIISNGVDVSEFDQMPSKMAARNRLGLPLERKQLLYLSRIHPRKGVNKLIKAFYRIAENYSDWDLFIAGPIESSSYFKQIRKTVLNNGKHADRIRFAGMLKGKNRISAFAACDLFALPSHFENFGMAIAEALSAKLPVITTTGTPWKCLETQRAGWWVSPDIESLTSALRNALSSTPEHLRIMGETGHEIVKKFYGWPAQASKMRDVYLWLLKRGQQPDFVCLG